MKHIQMYITPINPHQKDPSDVNINPLLKSFFITNSTNLIIVNLNRLFYC